MWACVKSRGALDRKGQGRCHIQEYGQLEVPGARWPGQAVRFFGFWGSNWE